MDPGIWMTGGDPEFHWGALWLNLRTILYSCFVVAKVTFQGERPQWWQVETPDCL